MGHGCYNSAMAHEVFAAVGHLVNDTYPLNHMGGGVAYASVAAARLGYEPYVVTKCPPNHPYVKELKGYGVSTHVLPSELNTITAFDNRDEQGRGRRQIVSDVQERIGIQDLEHLPSDLLRGATILLAPVINEVDMNLIPKLARVGTVSVIPQGYFREATQDGPVKQVKWTGFQEPLSQAENSIVVFSDEDITIDGQFDHVLLDEVIRSATTVALTLGSGGVQVYSRGVGVCRIGAFGLLENEFVDATGAGDVFATVFINEMTRKGGDIEAAAVAACYFAAIKIMGLGGIGIDSIPTLKQLRAFAKDNPRRIDRYLENNGVSSISFLE